MRALLKLSIASLLLPSVVLAAEPAPRPGTEYEYPELLVAPSASERLSQEAKAEAKNSWRTHWTFESSAALTLIAGVLASSDPGKKDLADGDTSMTKTASLAAYAIGGGWLATSVLLSTSYTPYQTGMHELGANRGTSKREQLAYERRAEESLYRPARISGVLKWTSFATNLLAGGFVAGTAKNDTTKIAGGMAAIASLLPLMFEHPWTQTYRFQEDYKKRIYGPLVFHDVSFVPVGQKLAATWTLGTKF